MQILAKDYKRKCSHQDTHNGIEMEIEKRRAMKTHENHPIPQPKQGRGLSNIPN
jgi:hypothetical protein